MGMDRGVWGERGLDGELALMMMMSMSRQALRRLAKAEDRAEDRAEWGWMGRDGDRASEQSMG